MKCVKNWELEKKGFAVVFPRHAVGGDENEWNRDTTRAWKTRAFGCFESFVEKTPENTQLSFSLSRNNGLKPAWRFQTILFGNWRVTSREDLLKSGRVCGILTWFSVRITRQRGDWIGPCFFFFFCLRFQQNLAGEASISIPLFFWPKIVGDHFLFHIICLNKK